MFRCHVCGSEEFHSEFISEVFKIRGEFYLVENIPATVCSRCGEEVLSRETTEQVQVMLHEHHQPIRSVSLDVLSYGKVV